MKYKLLFHYSTVEPMYDREGPSPASSGSDHCFLPISYTFKWG